MAEKTLYEVWYGSKSFLKNLKKIGWLYFVYVPQIKRDKLDKLVFYSTRSKFSYRIFQPNTNKLLISRDMQFIENDECD